MWWITSAEDILRMLLSKHISCQHRFMNNNQQDASLFLSKEIP
jgi:hypothetical protein